MNLPFTVVLVVFLSVLAVCSHAIITTGCINKNTPSSACCSGDIEISNTIANIESYAFDHCKITSVSIPNSVTYIGDWAFCDNQISLLTIPNSVSYIGTIAFAFNQISSLTIPSSVSIIRIEGDTFLYNQISSLTIPSSVSIISTQAFWENNNICLSYLGSVPDLGGLSYNSCPWAATEYPTISPSPSPTSSPSISYNPTVRP